MKNQRNLKPIIQLSLTLLLFFTLQYCDSKTNKDESKTVEKVNNSINDKSELIAKKSRQEKIKKTNYFLYNSSIEDENGITYALEVKDKEISRKKMYESEKIFFDDSKYIIVSSYQIEVEYKLFSNEELKDVIKYEGYILESKRSDRNGLSDWCSTTIRFLPELNDDDRKKKIISKFSGENCGMGKEINNKIIKTIVLQKAIVFLSKRIIAKYEGS